MKKRNDYVRTIVLEPKASKMISDLKKFLDDYYMGMVKFNYSELTSFLLSSRPCIFSGEELDLLMKMYLQQKRDRKSKDPQNENSQKQEEKSE